MLVAPAVVSDYFALRSFFFSLHPANRVLHSSHNLVFNTSRHMITCTRTTYIWSTPHSFTAYDVINCRLFSKASSKRTAAAAVYCSLVTTTTTDGGFTFG